MVTRQKVDARRDVDPSFSTGRLFHPRPTAARVSSPSTTRHAWAYASIGLILSSLICASALEAPQAINESHSSARRALASEAPLPGENPLKVDVLLSQVSEPGSVAATAAGVGQQLSNEKVRAQLAVH